MKITVNKLTTEEIEVPEYFSTSSGCFLHKVITEETCLLVIDGNRPSIYETRIDLYSDFTPIEKAQFDQAFSSVMVKLNTLHQVDSKGHLHQFAGAEDITVTTVYEKREA